MANEEILKKQKELLDLLDLLADKENPMANK